MLRKRLKLSKQPNEEKDVFAQANTWRYAPNEEIHFVASYRRNRPIRAEILSVASYRRNRSVQAEIQSVVSYLGLLLERLSERTSSFASRRWYGHCFLLLFLLTGCGKKTLVLKPQDTKAIQDAIKADNVPPLLNYFRDGLDPNSKDATGTPYLVRAAQAGDTDIVQTFLRYNADPNLTDAHGQTAMMAAAAHGSTDIINALLRQNADLNRKDAAGATALHIALTKQNLSTAERLKQAGAKE